MKTLNKGNLRQFENAKIKEYLLDGGNIPKLERIITNNISQLQSWLDEFDGNNPSYSEEVPEAGLEHLLEEVKEEVDSFLGVSEISSCSIGYFHPFNKPKSELNTLYYLTIGIVSLGTVVGSVLYDPLMLLSLPFITFCSVIGFLDERRLRKKLELLEETFKNGSFYLPNREHIIVERNSKEKMFSAIAHEYTHHLQNEKGITGSNKEYEFLAEGHARGVQRHIVELYHAKKNNPAYFDVKYYTLMELFLTYEWLCAQKAIEPNICRNSHSLLEIVSDLKIDSHCYGTTFFCLQEAEKEKDIYRQILHGEFKI